MHGCDTNGTSERVGFLGVTGASSVTCLSRAARGLPCCWASLRTHIRCASTLRRSLGCGKATIILLSFLPRRRHDLIDVSYPPRAGLLEQRLRSQTADRSI